MLDMLLQCTEKSTLTRERQIVILSVLLIAASERPWDVGGPRSVCKVEMEEQILETTERQATISTSGLIDCTSIPPMFCTPHITRETALVSQTYPRIGTIVCT
jgi:hypothetical protein